MQMQGVAKRDYCKKSDLVINGLQPIERVTVNIIPIISFMNKKGSNYNNTNYAIAYTTKILKQKD